ncbi:MAG: adenosylcobinamide-GDP ribazoletransferase [Alphaproteobacteria bacterium]|nr:adenosylcobinamide-GDP ribazoletransferase [Alphaproteobacteria bacterium]
MAIASEIKLCIGLLTRLKVSFDPNEPVATLTSACRWFPLIGVLVGALSGAALFIGEFLDLPESVTAMLAIAVSVVLTGAMHEDGLADVADGFGGGKNRDQKLEIMRDSRLGVYGTLALIIDTALRWALLTQLLTLGWLFAAGCLIAAGASSRLVTLSLMKSLPAARSNGLGASTGTPETTAVFTALSIAFLAVLPLKDSSLLIAIGISVAVAVGTIHWLAKTQIGGQTGDVLGAGQRIGETLALLCLVVVS